MTEHDEARPRIRVTKDGPYILQAGIPLVREAIACDPDGESVGWARAGSLGDHGGALCRCGLSASKPYCDGSHAEFGFDGTETASREPYADRAETLEGPGLRITDVKELCSEARHCHPWGSVWHEIDDTGDELVRHRVIAQCQMCPSGRYVAVDKDTGEPLERDDEPSVALVHDPAEACDGPLWLRGGIQVVAADGHEYEVRERQTLCRCGRSSNKPFCDGGHIAAGFRESPHE